MSRLPLTFACRDTSCVGTLDTASGTTGLLIVSGGNELRSGAFGGQSRLAAQIAEAGFPVFRFDRRGIGDSDGQNRGFREEGDDIEAAAGAFRAMAPLVRRVVAFGNCDAASALMLAKGAGCDGLILSNPWTIEQDDGAMPAAAIRARYAEKLRNPREILRLLAGKVNLRKLASGALGALKPKAAPGSLAQDMADGLAAFSGPATVLLAGRDRTAQMFDQNWGPLAEQMAVAPPIQRCTGATHAYVEPEAQTWLLEQILTVLRADAG